MQPLLALVDCNNAAVIYVEVSSLYDLKENNNNTFQQKNS